LLASILYQNSENDSETDQKDMPLILPFENNTNTNTNVWGLEFALIYRLKAHSRQNSTEKTSVLANLPSKSTFFFEVEKNLPTEIP
jgi:hypothetical protein